MDYRLYIKKNDDWVEIKGLNNSGLIIESNDPLDYSFGKSYKSYTINIPNISDNNLTLNNIFDRMGLWELDFDAMLDINNIKINGKLKIKNFNDYNVESQFLSSNLYNFKKNIGDKSLKELDFSEWNHTLNFNNVNNSWNGNLFGGDIIYDFIDRGSSTYFKSNPRRQLYAKQFGINEIQPTVKVKSIIDKLFGDYTVDYKFGDMDVQQFLDSLYLLYTQNQKRNTNGWKKDNDTVAETLEEKINTYQVARLFQPILTQNNEVLTIIADYEITKGNILHEEVNVGEINLYQILEYEIPENGTYRIIHDSKFDIRFESKDGTGSQNPMIIKWNNPRMRYIIQRKLPGGNWTTYMTKTIFDKTEQVSSTFYEWKWDDIRNEAGSFSFLDTTFMNQVEGTKFRLYCDFRVIPQSPSTTGVNGYVNIKIVYRKPFNFDQPIFLFGNENRNEIECWEGMGGGSTVTGEWLLPDIKAGDFLKDFLLLVNGEIYINDELKKVIVRNRFNDVPDIYDITKNIISGSEKFTPYPKDKNIKFRWKMDDKDNFNKLINGDESPFSRTINFNQEDDLVFEHPFSYTEIRKDQNLQLLTMWNNIENPTYSTDFNYRYVFYVGIQSFNTTMMTRTSTTTNTISISTIPKFSNISGIGLVWEKENVYDLYTAFHFNNIKRITEGGVLECDINVDEMWLNDIYYLNNRSLIDNYYIDIPKFGGMYQIIRLNYKKNNIFGAKLIRTNGNFNVQSIGDFNNDFNNDF